MKLLGRLGWRGQCACCNGPRDKRQTKREEEQLWQREWLARRSEEKCTCGHDRMDHVAMSRRCLAVGVACRCNGFNRAEVAS